MSIDTRREVWRSRVHVWQMLKSQVLHKSSLMSLERSVWNAASQVAEGTHPAKRKEASTCVAFSWYSQFCGQSAKEGGR